MAVAKTDLLGATVTGRAPAPRRTGPALAVLLAGAFMALLDTTIVNVALAPIRQSLTASESTLSWIVSGYALTFGLALIPAGRIGDRIGHKWIYLVGIALFTLGSLACFLATDSTQLVMARVVQGLGGGIFFTTVTALIQLMYQGPARGKAFALLGMVIGVSTALGPLIGGLIIQAFGETDGWRLIFAVNLPIGVATIIAGLIVLPRRGTHGASTSGSSGLDWFGLVLVSAGLVGLLVPLIEGQEQGWPVWTFASLAAGVVLLVVFALWERHAEHNGGSPLVPPHLFMHRSFTWGNVLAMVFFAAFTSIFFVLALLWQAGLGHSALNAGFMTLPFAVGSFVGSALSHRLAARYGRGVLMVGLGMVVVGLAATLVLLWRVPPLDLTIWMLAAPFLVGGLGSGIFIAPNQQFVVATVDPRDAGAASGVLNTAQRIGAAIGIAAVGSVMFGTLNVGHGSRAELASGFAYSATLAMSVSVALSIIAFGLVFTLPRRPRVTALTPES
ncbi:MFS transporter [Propionibacterium sp.]|uniref:MFS transporter n=1 Tax=Propionibacterium sp. TaxID=1977903 RepID=UPI0039E8C5F4